MNKYYVLLMCICFACKDGRKENEFFKTPAEFTENNVITEVKSRPEKIEVDVSSTVDGDYKDYFVLKNIIYLDNKSPMGNIAVVRQHEDRIFILDRDNAEQVFCYNLKGNLVWEFKAKGKGPLEYNMLMDFVINTKNNTIDLLDSKTYKVISLNMETGLPVKEFRLNCFSTEMVYYKDDSYLLYTTNKISSNNLDFKLLLVNDEKKVVSRNLKISNSRSAIKSLGFRSLEKFGDKVFFTEKFNDSIYEIKNDTLRVAYYVDFKSQKYPRDLISNFTIEKAEKMEKEAPFISNIDRVREKNGILNFSFSYETEIYTVFYNKENKKTNVFKKLKNGFLVGLNGDQVDVRGYIKEGFVRIIDSFVLNNLKSQMTENENFKNYLKKNKPDLFEVLSKIDSNSNPILLIYEYKGAD